MENYTKARTVEQPPICPFTGLSPDTPEVRVKDGSKIRNLMRFALSRMEAKPPAAEQTEKTAIPEEAGVSEPVRSLCKQIVFTANGKGISKAITCAEMVKRRVKGLHQLTKVLYSTAVEVWEPLVPDAGLDSLNVSRNLPVIWILLSVEPLDSSQLGYQAPGRYEDLWVQSLSREEAGGVAGHRRKRGEGGGRGRGKGPGRQGGRPRDTAK